MENFYKSLLEIILSLKKDCEKYEEDWGSLKISGKHIDNIYAYFKKINELLILADCTELIKFKFADNFITPDEFEDFEQSKNNFEWTTILNKVGLFEKKICSSYSTNFFLESTSANKWLKNLNPLEANNPINRFSPLLIIVCDELAEFGSETLTFTSNIEFKEFHKSVGKPLLPSLSKIQEHVHFISDIKISFNLEAYNCIDADYSSDLGNTYLLQCAKIFSSCLVNEYYSEHKLIINGIKRISLELLKSTDSVNLKFISKLKELVTWLYLDRTSTRSKLFYERLTLDHSDGNSLIESLFKNYDKSFSQANLRYDFVVLDRKDAYVKELKELLKDLRSQSDLYSLKSRTLLNNFLRDTLAILILIGFTIFTKFNDNIGLNKIELLNYIFSGLGIFLIVSMIFQIIVDITDLIITTKELKYWKSASNELISNSEFEKHYETIMPRKTSAIIIYIFIAMLYLTLAFLCFKYPLFIDQLTQKK